MVPKPIGLQRQFSDSSFGGSSLSSDYYAPTVSAAATSEFNPSGDLFRVSEIVNGGEMGVSGIDGSGWSRSWAQQTQESYQLQLALTVRVSYEATYADDSSFLDTGPDDIDTRVTSGSAEAISHRFWVIPFIILDVLNYLTRQLFHSWFSIALKKGLQKLITSVFIMFLT